MTVKVTAFFINGTSSTLTLSSNKKEMTTQVVNWKEVERVEFKYAKANGAIDNLVLTH